MPYPPARKLTIDDVYDSTGKPCPDVLKAHFLQEGRLSDECALKIITQCTAVLRAEQTMLEIEAPLTGMSRPKIL